MPKGFSRWDAAEFFKSDEDARLFVEEAARDGSPLELRAAIGTVARYLGVKELARRTGVSQRRLFAELNSLETEPKSLPLLLKRLGVTPGLPDDRADAAE